MPPMPILSGRSARRPRLVPELDDVDLGRLVKQLRRPAASGGSVLKAALISTVLEKTGSDWDRRSHRISVAAQVTAEQGLAAAWLAREPHSADALVFHAHVDLLRGLRVRRLDDSAELVSHCYQAADLRPEDPTPWMILLGAARIERYRSATVNAVWREATARDPWHREAHLQMLGYLSVEEGGSSAGVLEFVDAVRHQVPAYAPCAGLELTAAVRQFHGLMAQGGVQALTAPRLWSGGRVSAALDQAGNQWPSPGFFRHAAALADLNVLAYALCAAQRRSDAAVVFQALAGTVTYWPWHVEGEPVAQYRAQQARGEGTGRTR